jgi:hypothetical protein
MHKNNVATTKPNPAAFFPHAYITNLFEKKAKVTAQCPAADECTYIKSRKDSGEREENKKKQEKKKKISKINS